jgi:SAM-dependent methyltransferase
MNSAIALQNLPFYWRLRSDEDIESPVPLNYPLTLEFNELGHLSARRSKELLGHLETIYSLDYNIGYLQEGYEIAFPYMEDFWSYLLNALESLPTKCRILEVGCGSAMILKRLKDMGHEVFGIDPSPLSARASLEYGISIFPSLLEEGLDLGDFDLIYSMDVLEHAFNPLDFLTTSMSYLKTEGALVVSVPDAGPSIEALEISCAMHQHLQYFDSNSLRGILAKAGLFNIRVERAGYGGSLYGYATKSNNGLASEKVLNLPSSHTNKVIASMEKNLMNVVSRIQGYMGSGETLACYAPLRALPYLSQLSEGLFSEQIRFIDDTERWHGKYFDGTSTRIENLHDTAKSPPERILIFSMTFERELRMNVSRSGLKSKVSSLSEMLLED